MKNNTTKKSFVSVKDTGSGMDQGDLLRIQSFASKLSKGALV
jgi:hypothetical protein